MSKKKYIFIIMLLAVIMLCSLGTASWIIISQTQLHNDTDLEDASEYEKITPIITTDPTLSTIYQGEQATITAGVASNGIDTISGTWSCNTKTNTYQGTAKTSTENVTVTFTPADTNLYNTTTATVKLTMNPIAYNGSKYYGTVESAITSSASGTIYVYTFNDSADWSRTEVARTIKNDCTIASGVKLTLPYNGTSSHTAVNNADNATTYYRNAYLNPETYCKNTINVSDCTLNISGTLTIGGTLCAGGGGYFAGQTCDSYSQLNIVGNGKIIANNEATVNVYGFIKSTSNAEDFIFENGSTLLMPFVLKEFRGGTICSTLQNSDDTFIMAPFNRFTFPNIDGAYRIKYGAIANAEANLYASRMKADATATVIDTNNKSLITLTNANSYVDICYDSTKIDKMFGKMKLDFYHGASLNTLTISKSLILTTITVSTKGAYLPLAYNFDISLNAGNYDLTGQNIKLLTGSKLLINSDAKVTASNIIVYDTSPPTGDGGSSAFLPYPSTGEVGEGKLIINGTLEVKNFAGHVTTESSSGKLVIKDSVSINDCYDINNKNDTSSYDKSFDTDNGPIYLSLANEEATGNIYNGATVNTTATNISTGEYRAVKDSNNNYGWAQENVVNITYNENGGSTVSDITNKTYLGTYYAITANDLPTPTRDYYTFSHWEWNGTRVNAGTPVSGNVTLTAVWTANNYTLSYEYKYDDFTPTIAPTLPNSQTINAETNITLPTPTDEIYTFVGWFTNANCDEASKITTASILGKQLLDSTNGSAKLYGLWTEISFTLIYSGSDENHPTHKAQDSVGPAQIAAGILPNHLASTNEATWYSKYFDGWKYNGEKVTDYSFINTEDTVNTTYTLEAIWVDKIEVTITATYPIDSESLYSATVWYYNGQKLDFGDYSNIAAITNYDTKTDKQYYFDGWNIGDSHYEAKDTITVSSALTITANWTQKYHLVIEAINSGSSNTSKNISMTGKDLYLLSSQFKGVLTDYTSSSNTTYVTMYDNDVAVNKYFNGWSVTNATVSGNDLILNSNLTSGSEIKVTATWETKITVTVTRQHNSPAREDHDAKYRLLIRDLKDTKYYTSTTYTNEGMSAFVIPNHDIMFEIDDHYGHTLPTSWTLITSNVSYTISSSDYCLVEGTLITLADGSKKKVEDLTTNDLLLTYNHITGEFEAKQLWFNDHINQEATNYRIVNLKFSDGTVLRFVGEHGVFDLTLNRYVFISENNMNEFIGHKFYTTNSVTEIILTNVYVTEEYTTVYSPMTVGNLNVIAENILTTAPGPNGLNGFNNIFEYGENMKYNEEKMQADIEKYGLYKYEDFAEFIPEEVFNSSPIKYFKVAVGKGYITYDELIYIFKYMAGSDLIE